VGEFRLGGNGWIGRGSRTIVTSEKPYPANRWPDGPLAEVEETAMVLDAAAKKITEKEWTEWVVRNAVGKRSSKEQVDVRNRRRALTNRRLERGTLRKALRWVSV
jgi:hypothetical protein